MRKAVLVARDFAGCFGLAALKAALETLGMECVEFLGFGKPLTAGLDEIGAAAANADVVITGRSSSAELALPEIVALQAGLEAKRPCFIYSDGWFNLPPWFREFYEQLACLFVLHESCILQVWRVFPKAKVLKSGNPEWEEFFPGPDYSVQRTAMRARLQAVGAPADAQLILVPGVKVMEHNLTLWGDVAAAAASQSGKFCMIASMHPGDQTDPFDYEVLLAANLPTVFLDKTTGISTAQVVPASDWVISSCSTLGDRGSCQGKRVIDYVSPAAMARHRFLNLLLPEEEQGIWPPCQAGTSLMVTGGVEELEAAMQEMSTPEGFVPYRQAQLDFYGERGPAPGTAVRVMAEEITRVLSNC